MGFKVDLKFDLKPLEDLNKNLKEPLVIKLGILGDKAMRVDSPNGLTNATIGATHELGSYTKNIPRRSFLKDTLIINQNSIVAFTGTYITRYISQPKGIEKIFANVAQYCVTLVDRSFATGGFGKWQALKPQTIKAKGSSSILIDMGYLRRSIDSKVEKANINNT